MGTLVIANSILAGNSADSKGGGICGYSGATITIADSELRNNAAGECGGAIYKDSGAMSFTRVLVEQNSADRAVGLMRVWPA